MCIVLVGRGFALREWLATVGKTVDTAKLIATDMPRVLRSVLGKRERDDIL
jgi:hypothetical protein